MAPIVSNSLSDTRSVALTLTNNCNLNCVYCYEKHKNFTTMTIDVARNILYSEFMKNYDLYLIDLFGGEPFLEFELVKQIYHFIRTSDFSDRCKLSICTNGTVITDEMKEWIKENNSNLHVGLSLDGDYPTQDKNRSNSFKSIDLDFFKQLQACSIKATVSKGSLPDLCNDIKFLHTLGHEISVNLAYGEHWDENDLDILQCELVKLVKFYSCNSNVEPCTMLNMPLVNVQIKINKTIKKYCGVGTNMSSYSVDGISYPCQMFMPISVQQSEDLKTIKFIKEIPIDYLDIKCKSCILVAGCPTCYGSNYLESGDIYHKEDAMCKVIKLQYLATARIKYERIKIKPELTKEDRNELYSIKLINDAFSSLE